MQDRSYETLWVCHQRLFQFFSALSSLLENFFVWDPSKNFTEGLRIALDLTWNSDAKRALLQKKVWRYSTKTTIFFLSEFTHLCKIHARFSQIHYKYNHRKKTCMLKELSEISSIIGMGLARKKVIKGILETDKQLWCIMSYKVFKF